MDETFPVPLGRGEAVAVRVSSMDELADAASRLELPKGRPVLVVVGGASGMSAPDVDRLRTLFEHVIAPLAGRLRTTVVDGATDTGVMRLMGRARAQSREPFPLVGVVVDALTSTSGSPPDDDATPLEPNHTHFVLVPGEAWGDETAWLARLATVLSEGARAATILANGGEIAWDDVAHSVADRRPVIALAGTGRTADLLAEAVRGDTSDERAAALASSGLVHAVDATDRDELAWLLDDLLAGT